MKDGGPGKIVTFYSYKGGTGRSMALANVAWVLASAGKRVLVIDWDLEAPGLQRYFRPFLVDKDVTASEGLVDFLTDFILEAITPVAEGERVDKDWYVAQADILRYAVSLEWDFPRGGLLDFVPAGRQGPDYAARFAAINWQNFYDRLGGGAFFEAVKEQVRAAYDYVLIDSRTGVSDTAGICTIQMPDTLVVCFTFNNQSIEGAASVTRSAYEQRGRASYSGPDDFRIVPVPTRVDLAERDKLEQRKNFARWKFDPFLDAVALGERKAFWSEVEVPYIPYFAYEEILAPFKEDPSDPKTCLAAFVRIARYITDGAVAEYVPLISPEERQEVLQEFAQTSAPADEAQAAQGDTETQFERQLRLAEVAYARLDQQESEQARRLWTRLVRVARPDEGAENSKMRVQARDLDGVPAPVIEKFAAPEVGLILIGKDEKSGQSTFEAAGEELLRNWKRLLTWIDDDRPFLLWRQKLQSSIADWEAKGRAPDELLAGRSLAEAESFESTHRADLNQVEADYIQTSRAALKQRSVRYSKIAASVVIALLLAVMLAGLAVWAILERSGRAEEADALASQAESLIAGARARNTGEPVEALQTGLLLAVESQRLAPNDKAESLLKQNLALLPRRLAVADLGRNVLRVALSPDGKRLVAVTGRAGGRTITAPNAAAPAADDRAWLVVDVDTNKASIPVSFEAGAGSFELSPDGRYLAVVVERYDAGSTSSYKSRREENPADGDGAPPRSADQTAAFEGGAPLLRRAAFGHGGRRELGSQNVPKQKGDARKGSAPKVARAAQEVAPPARGVSRPATPANRAPNTQPRVRPRVATPQPRAATPAAARYSVEVTDVEGNRKAYTIPHASAIYDLTFSPAGRYLATASDDGMTQLLDLRSGKVETAASVKQQGKAILSVAFSGDSRFCATLGTDGGGYEVRVWRIPEAGAAPSPATVVKLENPAAGLLLNRDGSVFAIALMSPFGIEPAVGLFDVASGKTINMIGLNDQIKDIDFDPSGRFVVLAEGKVGVTARGVNNEPNVPSFADLFVEGEVSNITVSPDGKYVAATGDGRVARVWRAASGDSFPWAGLLAQGGNVNQLAFSSQGGFVATAGADNVARVWNLQRELGPDLARDEPCARLRRNLTAEEWGLYFPQRAFKPTCEELLRAR